MAAVATHDYLGEAERQLLREHVRTGRNAPAIVDRLNALGVELRTPVQSWRYVSGDFVALAMRNVHGSTPPLMAMSRTDGVYRHLAVHPENLRGEGGRSLGNPSKCWHEDDRVDARFENAVVRQGGRPRPLHDMWAVAHLAGRIDSLHGSDVPPLTDKMSTGTAVRMTENVYFELTTAFNEHGRIVILCSGQAVVYYRLAVMSKDGDWIVREAERACRRVREVLARRGARYRPGAPLDPRWLAGGWSSHFEFADPQGRAAEFAAISSAGLHASLRPPWRSSSRKLRRQGIWPSSTWRL